MTDVAPPAPTADAAESIGCNFAHFLVSLGSSALVHLGEVADPSSGRMELDLKLARHTIDVLRLLKTKTAGNLDSDESGLLEALLEDLGRKYATRVG